MNHSSKRRYSTPSSLLFGVYMIVIDIPSLEPARKHPYVFEQFKQLAAGDTIRLKNDHDPKPLYYQMVALLGEVFDWKYVKRGPEWEVIIRKLEDGEKPSTIGEIAAINSKKMEVLRKYGLDFCCGAGQTLYQACMEKGLDAKRIEDELEEVENQSTDQDEYECNCMRLDTLCDFIEKKHHSYVRNTTPSLEKLLVKITEVHGKQHPYLVRVLMAFRAIADELSMHMQKEEMVLFPYIRKLEESKQNGTSVPQAHFQTIKMPVKMMESEHVSVGNTVSDIRRYTSDFQLPEGACDTFIEAYRQLEAFEKDLHEHIHIENNILFPKAIKLEAELNGNP